jgi:hypothetical protein
MARERREETRLAKERVVSIWEAIRVWSCPIRSVTDLHHNNHSGEERFALIFYH